MANAISYNRFLYRTEKLVVDYLGLEKERDARVNGFAVRIILDLSWRKGVISSRANYTFPFPAEFHRIRAGELSRQLYLNDLRAACEKILRLYSDTTAVEGIESYAAEMVSSIVKQREGKGSCFGWTLFFIDYSMICGGDQDMLQKYLLEFCAQRAHAVFLHHQGATYAWGWNTLFAHFPQKFVGVLKRGSWNEKRAIEKCSNYACSEMADKRFGERGRTGEINICDYIPEASERRVSLLDRNALSTLLDLTQEHHVMPAIYDSGGAGHVVYWYYSPKASTYVYLDVNTACLSFRDQNRFVDTVVELLTLPIYKNFALRSLLCFGGSKLEEEEIGKYILRRYEATPARKELLKDLLDALCYSSEDSSEDFTDLSCELTRDEQDYIALELYALKYEGEPLSREEQIDWGRGGFLWDKHGTTFLDKIAAIKAYMAKTFLPTKSTTVEHKRN